MDAEWSFLGFISNLAARIQNNGGPINVPLRYFRLVTSLISACQVGPPSNPTSSFGTLPFSCAIVFIVSGTPPRFCSSTAYFRLTAMTTPRRTGTRGRGRTRWLPFYNTLALAFFLLGHGRDRIKGAPIRLHDIGLAPFNRGVGVTKQPFIF